MPIGASGSKSRSRETENSNQTQTRTLSERAAGALTDGINDARGMRYGRFDPSSIDQYQSPYTRDVIDASLGQADYRDAIARNEQRSDMAGAGAFGDNRRGIYEAELAGAQSRDRASLIAGLNDRAYTGARDVAVNENQNANQYDLALQQLLAQLRGGFASEGTQTSEGSAVRTGRSRQLGFTGSYGG